MRHKKWLNISIIFLFFFRKTFLWAHKHLKVHHFTILTRVGCLVYEICAFKDRQSTSTLRNSELFLLIIFNPKFILIGDRIPFLYRSMSSGILRGYHPSFSFPEHSYQSRFHPTSIRARKHNNLLVIIYVKLNV